MFISNGIERVGIPVISAEIVNIVYFSRRVPIPEAVIKNNKIRHQDINTSSSSNPDEATDNPRLQTNPTPINRPCRPVRKYKRIIRPQIQDSQEKQQANPKTKKW